MTSPTSTRAVLVGWSSADWRVVSPLLDDGLMPHLAALVERGVCGNLASLWPDLPPLLWTSIATGKRPHRHGVLGYAELDESGGVRPVTRLGRTAAPLWSIASRAGLESVVVNVGPTWPADPIAGVLVSNRFLAAVPGMIREPHAAPGPGLVHPEARAAGLAAACAAAMRVPDEMLRRFLPGLGSTPVHAAAVSIIASAIAEALATAAMVRHLAAAGTWSLLAVRFSIVEQLADRFLMFHPPRGPGIDASAHAAYAAVIAAAHRLLDDLLGEIVAAAGPEACIAVASDRGLDWARLRSPDGPPAGRARAASPGVLVLAGPGIRHDERISGATILDLCPTLLTALGLPVGADMDGRVLDDAFTAGPAAADMVPSWDEPCGPAAAAAPPPGSDAAQEVVRGRALTLARCLVSAGDAAAAEPVLRGLLAERPADVEAVTELAECLRELDRPAEAVALLERLDAPQADAATLDVLAATALVEAGRPADARARLQAALERHGPLPATLVAVARAEAALADYAAAEAACRRALAADAGHRPALVVLAAALYRLDRYAEAAEAARAAVALQHFDPRTHLLMGTALAACGRAGEAVAALETAVRQAPGLVEAHERLATVHARQRRDFAAADTSRRAARDAAARRAPAVRAAAPPAGSASCPAARIVIVSGLPRSGTSLMMQMLAAGGIPPLTDAARGADEDNPHGYLEFEAVKRLARDASWIEAARGRAVKVVCPLVPALPRGRDYRVVLMGRDMGEVLASQRAMLGRRGAGPAATDEQLRRAFERHLEQARAWCAGAGVPTLDVEHRACLTSPAAVAARVSEFLGMPLDTAAMARAVDVSLWRNRG